MNNTDYLLSWQELHNDTRKLAEILLAEQTSEKPWKGIICIARGGLIPATILARELNIRLVDTLCIASYDHTNQGEINIIKPVEGDGDGFLLVDDLVDSGKTAIIARELLPQAHFVCVYAKPAGMHLTKAFVREFPQNTWIHFPWDVDIIDGKPCYSPPLIEQLSKSDIE